MPSFQWCGKFTGKSSAARWLRGFDLEMAPVKNTNAAMYPQLYLQYLDLFLIDDAAVWVESNSEATRLLNEESPTQATIDEFTSLLKQKFPAPPSEEIAPITFDAELADLRQQSNETVTAYYKRTMSLMQKYGARDRSPSVTLSLAEGSLLDTFLRTWIRGLSDATIKRKCAEVMGTTDRSLRMLYDLAESTRRVNLEIQKLFEDETKENELQFYKDIAQRNMSKAQIDALLANYHAKAQGRNDYPSYQPPPSYRYEAPVVPTPAPSALPQQRPLASNPNRANQGPPLNNQQAPQGRPRYPPVSTKNLPDRKTSKNPWINGSRVFDWKADGRLCVRCGHLGHVGKECMDEQLPAWEQAYLKEIVFGNPPQVSFASASFGEYDGDLKPYGSNSSTVSTVYTPTTPSSSSVASPVNSLDFGTAGLASSLPVVSVDATEAAEAFLGEGSGPNKRARAEDEEPPAKQAPSLQQKPPVQQQAQPPQQHPYQFQAATEERPKRKGQKRVGRKIEPQPIVGMFNDTLGKYDAPISIRELLQKNKVDMTWMDFVAWSPAVCRELKRQLTRVAKKRMPKASAAPKQQPQFYQPMPQFPQPIPAYMMPPQTYQPMMSGGVQGPQTDLNQGPSFTSQQSSGTVSRITPAQAERHTRFLSAMIGIEKAFRVDCIAHKPDGTTAAISKEHTQADQGSDMNVISAGLVRHLSLQLNPLDEVGFKGLSMRTADHRETVLLHWVWLRLAVEGIMRDIRCFVAPELPHTTATGDTEYLSLILGIPWLYSVDAQISIRQSRIMIGDASIGEQVRAVTGPELVFCKDHNLLMYPKSAMPEAKAVEDDEPSSSDESSSDESDNVEDLDDTVPLFR